MFRVKGSGYRVSCLVFSVWGMGFRVFLLVRRRGSGGVNIGILRTCSMLGMHTKEGREEHVVSMGVPLNQIWCFQK